MKTNILFILLFLFCASVSAQVPLQIKSSKVHALLNFMDTMAGWPSTSPTLLEYGQANIPKSNTEFYEAVEVYKTLNLDYSAEREQYPELRHQYLSTRNLIIMASVGSRDLHDFSERIMGYLPLTEHDKLMKCLITAAPVYEQLIWSEYYESTQKIIGQISPYKKQIQSLFERAKQFYGGFWTKDYPFIVSLYPIPGESGYTSATPHSNVLVGSFMADNHKDYEGRLGVIVHEMCHIIFDEQPLKLQEDIEKWYLENDSPYARYAYNYIDEGLATAIGNGWAFEQIHGYVDSLDWYHDPYINQYAKAIFPLVKEYLESKKRMDKEFINQVIAIFEKEFPKCIYDYGLLLNDIDIYSDLEQQVLFSDIFSSLNQYFQVRSANFFNPIIDTKSLETMDKKQQTKMFFLINDESKTYKTVATKITDLQKHLNIDVKEDFILSFWDENSKSNIILINLQKKEDASKAFQKLAELKYINPDNALVKF